MARDPLDRYYTPQWAADAMVRTLADEGWLNRRSSIWEPHVGNGAFLCALNEVGHNGERRMSDIAPPPDMSWVLVRDAMDPPPPNIDIAVGNPPFLHAAEHIDHFLSSGIPTVAMLLRVGFLATRKRRAFWDKWPLAALYVFESRPSFTGKGTDSQEYACMVWCQARPAVRRVQMGRIMRPEGVQ